MKVIEEPQLPVKSKLPWFVDGLLYPISISGIIHLLIFLLAPFLIGLISRYVLSSIFLLGGILSLLLYLLFLGYVFFYLGYCIFHSAKGGWRAPDISFVHTPDKADVATQLFLVFGCLAVCFWPCAVYYSFTERADLIFWLLFVFGNLFFPMALLAGVLFDSFDALNPVLIALSIYRTLLPYIWLVPLFCLLNVLVLWLLSKLPLPGGPNQMLNYGFIIVDYLCHRSFVYKTAGPIYLATVAAHFLGRFYWRHKDKLNWGL